MSHPVNDEILENLYEEVYGELCQKYITLTEDEENALIQLATDLAKKRFPSLSNREVEIIAARRAKRLFWEMAQ